MRCRTCDYPLWNLKARQCPECGASFTPTDYDFIPHSVQYCCPHCDQTYFGTDERGHLKPREFSCVKCDKQIHMNQMAVRPAEGQSDQSTSPGVVPWIERKTRGRCRAMVQTIFYSLFLPTRLARGLRRDASTAESLVFGVLLFGVVTLIALFWFNSDYVNPLMNPWFFEQFAYDASGAILFGLLLGSALVGIVGFIPLWALVSHGLLRITGRSHAGADRTMKAIAYSAGCNLFSAIPCIGPVLGWGWWVVSATIMVTVAHRVHPLRAVVAVVTPALCAWILLLGGSLAAYKWQESTYDMYSSFSQDATTTQQIGAMLAERAWNNLPGQIHGIEIIDSYRWSGWSTSGKIFCAFNSETTPMSIPLTDEIHVADFLQLNRAEQLRATADVIESMPADLIAQRMGDFILVHHGADLTTNDPQLWTVVMLPDPDVNGPPKPTTNVVIGLNDYTVQEIQFSQLASEVAKQNQYRALLTLPPLPDLTTITHANPAVAASSDQAEDADGEGE